MGEGHWEIFLAVSPHSSPPGSCCCHWAGCGLGTELLLLCVDCYLSTQRAVNSQLLFLPSVLGLC